MLFVPVNEGKVHWTLAVVDFRKKEIQMYDSMHNTHSEYLEHLKRYLMDEHKDKKGYDLPDKDEWQLVRTDCENTPRQRNSKLLSFLDCPLHLDPLCY